MATLVDGRMPPAEEERAWAHVHGCPLCCDAVQREGWVKQQLAGLSHGGLEPVPDELADTLRDPAGLAAYPLEGPGALAADPASRPRRLAGLAVLSAGSLSAAMMGVVALGAAPANAPGQERRAPASVTQGMVLPTLVRERTTRPGRGSQGRDPGRLAREVAVTVVVGMSLGQQ